MTKRPELIFMTGATGFLGSWIIALLADRGVRVVATDVSDDYRRLALLRPDLPEGLVDVRVCDVTDAAALEALIAETRPSGIIHLAALQIPQCRAMPARAAAVNIGGHINVFEAARKAGIERIIYTSSIAAKPRGPENAPSNLYGVFKKTDEEIARIYWQDHRQPSLGLRPYVVYGVGRDDGETSAITRAIEAAALGQAYEIPFSTRSCFQYAGDVAEVFARAASASWDGALLSDITDRTHSTDDVLAAIQAVVPGAAVRGADLVRVSPGDGFDTGPLRQVIGEVPERSLTDGIRETVALYRRIAAR
ncbi:NAD-dependent epimerase/dehydratase family protein [Antarcticimicrobium luteum]|uniref:NAD(P)-dependent oxidoreductase n=1 Tax=Antarcticimicrobium luteum TaxID=2547397 RepID=A0A4R5VEG0_9RHOB|nr:NAD(P)-dependent oxidoreductase [Antarcticimicrobium luteum]TDK50690.1 NAD(P)-dependent oxidoreductase [Antarcticimicrobium luteum]